MKFLAIDTSGKRLTAIAYADGRAEKTCLSDCAMQHSVRLMDEIDGVLSRAGMSASECDFFAVVVGAGSFTGIRIGISTVKGLCLALGKPALSVTSFDCIAYAEESVPVLALVDAGHGCYYACAYGADKRAETAPCFLPREEAEKIAAKGYAPVSGEPLSLGRETDAGEGLLRAVLAKSGETAPAERLTALYIRKSSAEENRA